MGGVTTARPTLATRRTYSWTSRTASFAQVSSLSAKLAPTPGQPQLAALQLPDAVPDCRGLLELEVRRRRLHLLLQPGDVRVELRLRLELPGLVRRGRHRHVVPLVDAGHHLVDALDDRRRRDAVLRVVRLLDRPAAVRLADRVPHRIGR